ASWEPNTQSYSYTSLQATSFKYFQLPIDNRFLHFLLQKILMSHNKPGFGQRLFLPLPPFVFDSTPGAFH
ncbi:hypothetical protein, partial [Pelotomaculum schinkii]|uniref:hypothetical protein n=1 Tax=Pelotomaculum schinkii TaxID=78350 RepID=UPI0019D650AD